MAKRTHDHKRPEPPAATPAVTTADVPLEELAIGEETQARARLNPATVEEYAEAMREGVLFEPVALFTQGDEPYWVADGFHRIKAARQVGFTTIAALVRQGSKREALLYACAANATHGLPRTNADKRKAVETLLRDDEWGTWSDNHIAQHCGVSQPFVSQLRASLKTVISDDGQRTYVTKHGTVATMATARIGTRAATTAPANGEPAGVEEDEAEDLPAFLCGEGWTRRERAHAYARYLGLPADLQPPVAALLNQTGICVPDICAMLARITAMDETQRAELVRLQTSADAYERSCAITLALKQPPPPHPRVMLLYDVRRELVALTHRVESAATRYPDLPGAAEVAALGACLAATANKIEALIDNLRQPKEA
jgi:ParB-like nuclease domain